MKKITLIELQELIDVNGIGNEFVLSSENQYITPPVRIDYELVFNSVVINPYRNEIKFCGGDGFFKLSKVVEVNIRTISGNSGHAIDIFSQDFSGANALKYTVLAQ